MSEGRTQVILLPGGVLPAGPAYSALLAELGPDVDARPKELEVYAADAPPPDYSLATEVAGITRVADDAGFDRFHLVGYSGGGASSLAFAASQPERLLSLAVMEPAFAGWQEMSTAERSHMERFRPLLGADGPELLTTFQSLQIAPGVDLVPPRPDLRPRGWPSGPPGSTPSSGPSSPRTSISTPSGDSTGQCGSRSAVGAIPTTTPGWPSVWRASSRTSPSRCSPIDITSTRHTGSSLPGSPHPCGISGREAGLPNRSDRSGSGGLVSACRPRGGYCVRRWARSRPLATHSYASPPSWQLDG